MSVTAEPRRVWFWRPAPDPQWGKGTGPSYRDTRAAFVAGAQWVAERPASSDDEREAALARIAEYEAGGEEPLTDAERESIMLGRCGPLLHGGPCWLMPGHKPDHHCYREDVDAVVEQEIRRQGPVSVSREQVNRAALDAARAVRGVTAHLRDADRLHVTAALHSLKITVTD